MGWQSLMTLVLLANLRSLVLFPTVYVLICIPTNSAQEFLFAGQHLLFSIFLIIAVLTDMNAISFWFDLCFADD